MTPDEALERNRRERRAFLRRNIQWVRDSDNYTWSSQQAVLINSLVQNGANFMMGRDEYLEMKARARRSREGAR